MAMAKHTGALIAGPPGGLVSWLAWGAVGPGAVALPVNWAADRLADAAVRWFKRLRHADDLSRLVKAADTSAQLDRAEITAVRKLLQDEKTWRQLGGHDVTQLSSRIVACLPSRDGRTAEASYAAAEIIARGLLEFAIFDLEPDIFQKVVLARLQQMTDQASALDKALYDLHSDLYARVNDATDLLKRVTDRLPPGPAGHGEITIYLKTLIGWLNTDPWPRDQRFHAGTLTPAEIECKLRVKVAEPVPGQDADADELARRCSRLVILGGPGSGKTWLAKRTARRCAEDALAALAAGATLNEIELPLYTTCYQLFREGGDIRTAGASSALNDLADLGGSRITDALRVFFTERSTPTLLVIDSLDEAPGPSSRLGQADALPWRIVLTSRPSSWNQQLNINEKNQAHRVGELQPLRYPDDVEPAIQRWFADKPERGQALTVQIAQRPSLQQGATVPLILAFYCILGGDQPLPEFRHELYTSVLPYLFTAPWHGISGRPPEPDVRACLKTLRSWAWSGAMSDSVSGIRGWEDDILVESIPPGGERDALDHVAPPRGFRDDRTGKTSRRFIHRSIREHLVAEHVAGLPVNKAVKALLPHLWYDPDWEYTAPTAIAMHPKRDKVVQELLCRAACSGQVPRDLSAISAGREVYDLLARVAAESKEDDWSPEAAAIIGQARMRLTQAHIVGDLGGAVFWPTSNGQIREELLRLLAGVNLFTAVELAETLIQLATTAEDKRRARQALLGLLVAEPRDRIGTATREWRTAVLAATLARLDPTAGDKLQALDALLRVLGSAARSGGRTGQLAARVVELATTAESKRQARAALVGLLAALHGDNAAAEVVDKLVQLEPTADDKRQAREALLRLLAASLMRPVGGSVAVLVGALTQLHPTAEDKRQAREVLLESLGSLAGPNEGRAVAEVAGGLVQLDPTADDKRQARAALVRLLAGPVEASLAPELVRGLVQLDPTADDKRQARAALLRLLADPSNYLLLTAEWVGWLVQFAVTADDQRQTREALLGGLGTWTGLQAARTLVGGLVQLDPTAEDQRQTREALLRLLARTEGTRLAYELVGGLTQLSPTAEDQRQTREALLRLLACPIPTSTTTEVVGGLARLGPTAEDQRQAREALLRFLAVLTGRNEGWAAMALVGALIQLDPTAEDKRQARAALLSLLTVPIDAHSAATVAECLARLDPTAEDQRQAREVLLGLLANPAYYLWIAATLAEGLSQLNPTAEDKREAREALLDVLAASPRDPEADTLGHALAQLDPTVHDLATWRALATAREGIVVEVVAAVRRNTALGEWLEVLPSLIPPSHSPTATLYGRHKNRVLSVAYAPDGATLAGGGADGTVRIWDARTGQQLQQLTGPAGGTPSVAYAPDGAALASTGRDGVRIWDPRTGQQLHQLTGHASPVWSVAYAPDGAALAGGGADGAVRIWDARTGQQLQQLTGHAGRVPAVAYAPDGAALASGGEDGTVRIWDARTGQQLHQLTDHAGRVRSVAYAPDGAALASGGVDGVRIWDPRTGQLLQRRPPRT
jgi:tetratricopeptide (TPR) repeat protein